MTNIIKSKILLIYTGGTIGMKEDPETMALSPFEFNQILIEVPELKKIVHTIDTLSFEPPIDSSDINLDFWVDLATKIKEEYLNYDGFVILHGTDTMSFTASALSFMINNLEKPIILTGSQLPIGKLRTDGKENLISSIEIAASRDSIGRPIVPEVCIYFDNKLFRGNRTTKFSAENFKAFFSPNYPALAESGIHIKYNKAYINYPKSWGNKIEVETSLNSSIAVIKLFPGITPDYIKAVLETPNIRAIIIETFGSGNAPTCSWFISLIEKACKKGILIVNITQCLTGSVDMDAYSTGITLKKAGVIGGYDSTFEAAICKLFFLMGKYPDNKHIKEIMNTNIKGEISFN